MPRNTECYKAASLPLELTLSIAPGGTSTVVDGGNFVPFVPTEFPYAGDCVGKTPWNEARDVIVRSCAGCHAATPRNGATSSLVDYADLRVDTERNPGVPAFETMLSYLDATDGHPQMPPLDQTPLTVPELAMVKDWIAQGGPECNDGTTPTTFTPIAHFDCGPVNYDDTINPIISVWCAGCHDQSQSALPIFVNDYDGGRALNDHAYYKPLTMFEASLERIKDGSMPPYGGVPQADVDAFEAWIQAGYPEGLCL